MAIRRRTATLVVLTVAGSGGFAAAAATSADDPPQVPAAVARVHTFLAKGPAVKYGSDWGAMFPAPPLTWQQPGSSTTSAVVEASFQYRTHGTGPFVVTVGVQEPNGPRLTVRPARLTLAQAPAGSSTTVRFLVPELPGGRTYEATLGVNSVPADRGRNQLTTRKVLLTVDGSAS